MPDPTKPHPDEPEKTPLRKLAAERTGALETTDSVEAAGQRLREQHVDRWPVAKERKLVGMIEEQNPDWELGGHGHDPKTWKVGQIMNSEVIFCYEDEDCATARQRMEERGLKFLPVVDRQMRVVGIFSREEVGAAAAIAPEKSAER